MFDGTKTEWTGGLSMPLIGFIPSRANYRKNLVLPPELYFFSCSRFLSFCHGLMGYLFQAERSMGRVMPLKPMEVGAALLTFAHNKGREQVELEGRRCRYREMSLS